jgi:hypothetical protein
MGEHYSPKERQERTEELITVLKEVKRLSNCHCQLMKQIELAGKIDNDRALLATKHRRGLLHLMQ